MPCEYHLSFSTLDPLHANGVPIFPSFIWATPTAACQTEGEDGGGGEPRTHLTLAGQNSPAQVTGSACRCIGLVHSNLDAMQPTGLSLFRLGAEWARIQPGSEIKQDPGVSLPSTRPAHPDIKI